MKPDGRNKLRERKKTNKLDGNVKNSNENTGNEARIIVMV